MSIALSSGTVSRRFQIIILVGVIGLFAATAWFTYGLVHTSDQNARATLNAVTQTGASRNDSQVTNFQQCAAAGNPVEQTYPQTCITKSGQHFTDN